MILKPNIMKMMKHFFLLILTISIFSCSDDDTPPCVPVTWYADADGDSLGDPNETIEACEQPEGFVGNSNDTDDTDPLNLDPTISATVTNLYAPQTGGQGQGPIGGEFTKFDFTTGQSTTSETEWDFALRGTTIIINGGAETGSADEPLRNGNAAAYIHDGSFDNLSGVTSANFVQDSSENGLAIPTGSGYGWYTYENGVISAAPNKVLVIRTRDGKYAKVRIISYYKDEDPSSYTNARYYTFDYLYQPNDGIATF
jgi:hypothetical protein